MSEMAAMFYKIKGQKYVPPFLFFCLAFAVRTIFALCFADIPGSGDAAGKLHAAYCMGTIAPGQVRNLWWILVFPSVDWLPLYYWINSIVSFTFKGNYIALQLTPAVFGSLNVALVYWAVKRLFGRFQIVSALTICFLPCAVWLSAMTMTEVYYLTFAIPAVVFAISYRSSGGKTNYVLLVLSVVAASLIRYEGWLLLCGISVSLVLYAKGTKNKIIAAISCIPLFAGCFLIFFQQYMEGNELLYGVTQSDRDVAAFKIAGEVSTLNNAHEFLYGTIPLAILGFLYAWVRFRKLETSTQQYLIICSVPFMGLLAKFFTGTLLVEDRYVFIHSVFLMPLGFMLIADAVKRFSVNAIAPAFYFLPLLIAVILFPYGSKLTGEGLKQPTWFNAAVQQLRTVHSGIIFLDKMPDQAEYSLVVKAQLPGSKYSVLKCPEVVILNEIKSSKVVMDILIRNSDCASKIYYLSTTQTTSSFADSVTNLCDSLGYYSKEPLTTPGLHVFLKN